MVKFIITGNLGADAVLHKESGREFVTMSIAETQRRTDESGNVREVTKWISATLNGDGGKLLPYLVKGAKVCVIGDGDVRQYHSEKQRALVPGMNVFIREIELIGGKPDAVPGTLYDKDGAAHSIFKYFFCPTAKAQPLFDRAGREYVCDDNGWVANLQPQDTTQKTEQQQTAELQPEQATESQEKKKSNKNTKNEPEIY